MEFQRRRKGFVALLLAQVGAHAAKQFAERLSALNLTPAHAGILRRLSQTSGMSQRALAEALGMHARRLVGVVDEMESLGLIVRQGNAEDRRTYSLQVTPQGRETMARIGEISFQHNSALCAALSADEAEALVGLLQRIADQQGLIPGVHPGFNTLGVSESKSGLRDLPET